MTNQEKLEAVKASIVEAIPEIIELKFGCKIVNTNGEVFIFTQKFGEAYYFRKLVKHLGIYQLIGEWFQSYDVTRNTVRKNGRQELFEIIGRDITLEDVLLTLNDVGTLAEAIVNHWYLGKPLHEQSGKTINFLYSILCA